MQSFEPVPGSNESYIECLNRKVTSELIKLYPNELEQLKGNFYLPEALETLNKKFIFIVDEWDFPLNKYKDDQTLIESYIDLLRKLFKETNNSQTVSLVYMTGILPLAR